jgi:hypothetical protein
MPLERPFSNSCHHELRHNTEGFTEFPPDPHKGFDVPSAVITMQIKEPHANSEGGEAWLGLMLSDADVVGAAPPKSVRFYTEPLGVMMPTCDFSMPYNVRYAGLDKTVVIDDVIGSHICWLEVGFQPASLESYSTPLSSCAPFSHVWFLQCHLSIDH